VANLGICRKCAKCLKISLALVDNDGNKISSSQAHCSVTGSGVMEWESVVPDACPYKMEHMVTEEAVFDLAEESKSIKKRSHTNEDEEEEDET